MMADMPDAVVVIDVDVWRHPNERADLVERCIRAEGELARVQRAMRELMGSETSYVQALIAQRDGLQRNLDAVMRQSPRPHAA
jgi:hypothetical protein